MKIMLKGLMDLGCDDFFNNCRDFVPLRRSLVTTRASLSSFFSSSAFLTFNRAKADLNIACVKISESFLTAWSRVLMLVLSVAFFGLGGLGMLLGLDLTRLIEIPPLLISVTD